MFSPTVQLRSGGYIVINQTEALVAIDVNSGRSTREHHIEDTALKTNVEASEEVARQLRLRDLAGLIVIDYIDMDEKRNNRTVERRLKDALRNDRARIQVGRISHFGLMEMSRQRIRTSVLESSTEKCPHCGGTGHVRSVSSVALQLLRSIEETLLKGPTHNLIIRTRPDIALYVLNHKRAHLRGLEERFKVTLTVNADEEVGGQIGFTIDRGEQVMTHRSGQGAARAGRPGRTGAARGRRAGLPRRGRRGERRRGIEAEIPSTSNTPDRSTRFPTAPTTISRCTPTAGDGARENGDGPRDGRGRRRRRRRGRGGRGGEGREGGPFPPRHEQARPRLASPARSGAELRASRKAASIAAGDGAGARLCAAPPGGRRATHQRRRRTAAQAPRTARRTAQSPRRRTGQRRFRRHPGSGNPRAARRTTSGRIGRRRARSHSRTPGAAAYAPPIEPAPRPEPAPQPSRHRRRPQPAG